MDWKNELVTSEHEAFDFMWRRLGDAGLPYYTVENASVHQHARITPTVHVAHKPQSLETEILYLDIAATNNGGCFINDFFVGENFRGKGISLMAAKAMLGLACKFDATFLEFSHIYKDDPGFWSALGAVPYQKPVLMADDIRAELNTCDDLATQDRQVLRSVLATTDKNPFLGWRVLSQSKNLSDVGKQARQRIFANTCYDHNLVMIPSEPGTNAILQEKLGVLPPFRPLGKQEPYATIYGALAPHAAATWQLSL